MAFAVCEAAVAFTTRRCIPPLVDLKPTTTYLWSVSICMSIVVSEMSAALRLARPLNPVLRCVWEGHNLQQLCFCPAARE